MEKVEGFTLVSSSDMDEFGTVTNGYTAGSVKKVLMHDYVLSHAYVSFFSFSFLASVIALLPHNPIVLFLSYPVFLASLTLPLLPFVKPYTVRVAIRKIKVKDSINSKVFGIRELKEYRSMTKEGRVRRYIVVFESGQVLDLKIFSSLFKTIKYEYILFSKHDALLQLEAWDRSMVSAKGISN